MTPQYKWVAETMSTLQTDAGCLAAHAGGDAWRCFLAQEVLPHITSPIFATQDLVDSWQMANIFALPCVGNLSACTPAELADMQQYRADMLALLAPLTSSATNGGFLSACVQHCHQNIDDVFVKEQVQSQSVVQTFMRWWTGEGGGDKLVIDGLYGTNKMCFGVPYACSA